MMSSRRFLAKPRAYRECPGTRETSPFFRLLVSKSVFLLLSIIAAAQSYAWDGVITGAITQIDITDGSNYGFRVWLASPMCANANNWAYLNNTDSNYNTYAAALLSAKAQGAIVSVYSNQDANGYCHIQYLALL